MVSALPDEEVKEILYHPMPNFLWTKMTGLGYKYLYKTTNQMSGFFEIQVENLETPLSPLAVGNPTKTKEKKKNSNTHNIHNTYNTHNTHNTHK